MHNLRYGTCAGAWGDVICSLGNFRKHVGSGGVIFFGNDPTIVDFLACQEFIETVEYVRPAAGFDWIPSFWNPMVNTPSPPFDPLDIITRGLTIPRQLITPTHHNYASANTAVNFWSGGQLPEEAYLWADKICESLPRRFYMVQPYSLNSNGYNRHWPYWGTLMQNLLDSTAVSLVLVGNNLPQKLWGNRPGNHANLIDLIGKIPSMAHVFALSEKSNGIITTSNSLAHWCQVQSLPTVVCCNTTSSQHEYYFRKSLDWPTLTCLDHSSSLNDALFAVHERLGQC